MPGTINREPRVLSAGAKGNRVGQWSPLHSVFLVEGMSS